MEKFLKVAECPVCLGVLDPPVVTCENGHAICHKCKIPLDNCPTCRGNFTESKNTTLNQLLASLPEPCVNAANGCYRVLSKSEKSTHEKICDYRLVKCADMICTKEGLILLELYDHLKSHSNRNITFDQIFSFDSEFVEEFSSLGLVLYESHSSKYFSWRKAIDWNKKIFTVCVLYIGRREKAKDYLYEMSFIQNYNIKFSFGGYCLPYMDNNQDIMSHPDATTFEMNKVFFKEIPSKVQFKVTVRVRK